MPQPGVPSAATCSAPNGVGRLKPNTSSAVSGTLNSSATSCNAITTLGRDTAVLKPRNAVNSRAGGNANASAVRWPRTLAATSGEARDRLRNGCGKSSTVQPATESASASHIAWCNCSPHSRSLPAPNSWPATGPTASTTPIRPMKTVV